MNDATNSAGVPDLIISEDRGCVVDFARKTLSFFDPPLADWELRALRIRGTVPGRRTV